MYNLISIEKTAKRRGNFVLPEKKRRVKKMALRTIRTKGDAVLGKVSRAVTEMTQIGSVV